MKKIIHVILALAATTAFVACDDSSNIGSVLDYDTIAIEVDSNFVISQAQCELNPSVPSRTISQLLGAIDAPGYGTIYSDFVAQYMPSTTMDTTGITAADIDSVKLFIQMAKNAYVGDTLVPMGLTVYNLTKELPYPIYSNFAPEGYYDPRPVASVSYTASLRNEPDSIKKRTSKAVTIPLNVEWARSIFNAYKANPANFSNPTAFVNNVFRGLYIRSSYGSGRICDFTANSIRFYYHKVEYNTDSARYDTTKYVGDYMAVTPEMIVNNNIRFKPAANLTGMIADGDQVIAAPAGYEVKFDMPAQALVDSYHRSGGQRRVLNTLTLSIPADSIGNKYGIGTPPYVLMVLASKKDEFYASNTVPDNKTAFYAAYNPTTASYEFSALRGYMLYLLGLDRPLTSDDYRFVLCPAQVVTEKAAASTTYNPQTVVTSVVPYVSKPAMAKISLKNAKIKLTFSVEPKKK